ncbi:MAG: hypothetical protein A2542_01670 [Parcubacteria group bacterium RIFOXYD2_FULL_52_8]|nr:MAG: hypothetical protein A2542_01670 [Parcubacteria group bacterium RIFOXYD2_FULL_52_8]
MPTFSPVSIIDITLVAFLVYTALILLRRTHSIFIFRGVVALFAIYLAATYFNLALTHALFQFFFSFFVIILVVVFQRELRRFFEEFSLSLQGLFVAERTSLDKKVATELVSAVTEMAKKKRGALLVIPGKQPVDRYLEGGYFLGGELSKALILSIFDPSSPGHDGALVIKGDRAERFAAQLPLAAMPVGEYGTRHRAGVGLSERTDAFVIIVSEERGVISVAEHGILRELKKASDLAPAVETYYREELHMDENPYWVHLIKDNYREKLLAVGLSLVLWYVLVAR